jgi:hypothetical protein
MCVKGEAEATSPGPNRPRWLGLLAGPRHLVSFADQVALSLCFLLKVILFHKKFSHIFPRIYFHQYLHQKGGKVVLLKTALDSAGLFHIW